MVLMVENKIDFLYVKLQNIKEKNKILYSNDNPRTIARGVAQIKNPIWSTEAE